MSRFPLLRPSAVLCFLIALLGGAHAARAQTADAFNPGANQTISTVAIQPDGKILVGGGFTGLGGGTGTTVRNHIGRLNADGTVDPTFNPGANSIVQTIALQPDGGILIGGNFTSVGGGTGLQTVRNHIARLNPDGSVDASFNPGANHNVYALAVQPDGMILAGGEFSTMGGGGTGTTTRNRLARLTSGGALDSFNPGASKLPAGASAIVYTMALQPDGKVIVGGYFNGLGGGTGATVRNFIGRLNGDGSVDAGFNPGANSIGGVNALALQPDGAIVIGGSFTGLGLGTGAIARQNIGRVDTNGVVDVAFNPGAEAQVLSLEAQVDGRIVAAGYFKWVGAAGGANRSVRNYIARLDASGLVDPTFNPGADNVVNAVAVQADGAIIVAGIALSVGGLQGNGVLTTRNRIARFAATDAAVQTLTFSGGGTLPTNMAWARSGGGPEVSRVTFAFSFDGSFYSSLGEGTRVAGGWQLNNAVNLPLTRTVWYRAQGFYGSGYQSASGSIVESVVVSTSTLPTLTLGRTALRYRAVTSGATFVYQTGAQVVPLTRSGAGAVSWTATPDVSWIQVSPASGTGPANLQISVSPSGLPIGAAAAAGSITFTTTGAANNPGPINVVLSLVPDGGSDFPFGVVDTPTDNRTGVSGAIPFTGWMLDDVDVAQVMICRSAFGAEVAPVDPNCGGAAQIFVGFGTFIEGARPDVAAGYPTYPRNYRAGWGFMALTNMLPNQGNGVYSFSIYGRDVDGHTVLLGTRTMTCNNAGATLPFGTIDTPSQGGTVSGSTYVNFGWALTQINKSIPVDGSTITVVVDGVAVGNVDYNHYRPDIATLFPGLANSNGAIGFRILDTTTLTDGLHTVSWTVRDSGNNVEGLGSRFFLVANGTAPLPSVASQPVPHTEARAEAAATAPFDPEPVVGRRGWDLDGPWRTYGVGAAGRVVVRGEEVDRFELELGEHQGQSYSGYLRVGDSLAPLPIGSQLNGATGRFTWAPGVGFIGTYDLVFVRWAGAEAVGRRDVRIVLAAKGSGHTGTQVVIDTPGQQQDVPQPFVLGGWAADLDATAGTGIDTLHVWAYPLAGGPPVFLGVATYGGARPDVAAIHGERFRETGFGITVEGLAHGNYDLAVFPWSNVAEGFMPATVVRVTVR